MSVQAYTLVQVFSVTHSKSIEGFCIYVVCSWYSYYSNWSGLHSKHSL